MAKGEKTDVTAITRRLDAIIHILIKHTQIQEMTARDQIILLRSVGLKDAEIASILGKTRGYVSSEVSKVKSRSG
jgi:DNA-binding CsgD family transcriptional regulator